MCVLQVADGSYAFVLHTANPLTGRLGEMFGELVPGLGEVLVGDMDLAAKLFAMRRCHDVAERLVDGF